MQKWTVEYVDGKAETFSTEPQGIQVLAPGLAVLVVHRTLGQSPLFLNLNRVQKWYCDSAPTLAVPGGSRA